MAITVKIIATGNTVTLSSASSLTVSEIKTQICDTQGIPIKHQKIKYTKKNKTLKDGTTVSDGSELSVQVVQVKGGCDAGCDICGSFFNCGCCECCEGRNCSII